MAMNLPLNAHPATQPLHQPEVKRKQYHDAQTPHPNVYFANGIEQ